MSPDTLSAAGRCLHGFHWQVPLSRDLSVAGRTMRRWAKSGAPDSIAGELVGLLKRRQIETSNAIGLLSDVIKAIG